MYVQEVLSIFTPRIYILVIYQLRMQIFQGEFLPSNLCWQAESKMCILQASWSSQPLLLSQVLKILIFCLVSKCLKLICSFWIEFTVVYILFLLNKYNILSLQFECIIDTVCLMIFIALFVNCAYSSWSIFINHNCFHLQVSISYIP